MPDDMTFRYFFNSLMSNDGGGRDLLCSMLVQNNTLRHAKPLEAAYGAQSLHLMTSLMVTFWTHFRSHLVAGFKQLQHKRLLALLSRAFLCVGLSVKKSTHVPSSWSWPTMGHGKLSPDLHHCGDAVAAPHHSFVAPWPWTAVEWTPYAKNDRKVFFF